MPAKGESRQRIKLKLAEAPRAGVLVAGFFYALIAQEGVTMVTQKSLTVSDYLINKTGTDATAETVEKYVKDQIRYRLERIKARFHLCKFDLDDVRQNFVIALVDAFQEYDSNKASWQTFTTAVINNTYKNQLRKLEAQERLLTKNTVKIEDLDEDHHLTPGYMEDNDTPSDVAYIIAQMPAKLQTTAQLLKKYKPAEVARKLKIGKSTVTRHISLIRKYFSASGYDKQKISGTI